MTTFGETRPLPDPFFVLATQNPIELEGTYPLPEAQLDRFMFKVEIVGVDQAVLEEILLTRIHGEPPALEPVLSRLGSADISFERWTRCTCRARSPTTFRGWSRRRIRKRRRRRRRCATSSSTAARRAARSPSAPIARGLALLRGKPNVGFDEVRRVAAPALAHRLVLDYAARLEGWDGRRVIARTAGVCA